MGAAGRDAAVRYAEREVEIAWRRASEPDDREPRIQGVASIALAEAAAVAVPVRNRKSGSSGGSARQPARPLGGRRAGNPRGADRAAAAHHAASTRCSRVEKTKRRHPGRQRAPTVEELERLASDLNKNASELNECLADLWDIDDSLLVWRREHGF